MLDELKCKQATQSGLGPIHTTVWIWSTPRTAAGAPLAAMVPPVATRRWVPGPFGRQARISSCGVLQSSTNAT
jgi:hypothetical protein